MPILTPLAAASLRQWGFLASLGGAGFTIIQTFTASGSWVCPTGVTEVEYLVVAGGGAALANGAAGGGAGGFRTGTGFSVSAGTTYTVTVGAGGAAGANNGNDLLYEQEPEVILLWAYPASTSMLRFRLI